MLFWLKKILTLPFLPLHFALIVGSLGLLFLWRERTARRGRFFVTAALAALVIFSNKGVALLLMRPLESQYAPIPEVSASQLLRPDIAACRYVVVLGGGHGDGTTLSRVNQLGATSLSRLAEAIRVLRLLPAEAKLVVSGHNGPDHPSHAQILAEAAMSLGVAPERIVRFDDPRDTEDEVNAIKQRLGPEPVLLVTSAYHLPRAMALARGINLYPVPCPADFFLKPGADEGASLLLFDLGALERSTKSIREYIGLLWAKLRGKA
jgi:uncharacterized SAM-binding protein YcdF (DUF218 family)